MSKHTPGPWSYRKLPRKQEWEIDTGHCPNLGRVSWTGMAVVFGCDDDPKIGKVVGEANARLIAATPDLLEALKEILYYIGDRKVATHGAMHRARAAIAKATGEPA